MLSTDVASRAGLQQWERAEIARSAVEASLTSGAIRRASEYTRRRYRRPPADTAYPLEYAFHLIGDVSGQRVLDLGCGSGENTLTLALKRGRVAGVDISADLVGLARKRLVLNDAPSAAFLVASAHDLPFPDASVDLVVGIAVLHHLDLPRVAREVRRVLRPGGRAVFQEPVRNSPMLRALRRLIPHRAPDVSPYERPLTDGEIAAFSAGFTPGRSRTFGLPHVRLAHLVPGVRDRIGGWYRADRWLLARHPWLARYAAMRVFEVINSGTEEAELFGHSEALAANG